MNDIEFAFLCGCLFTTIVYPALNKVADKIRIKPHGCHDCKWCVKSPCANPEYDYYDEYVDSQFLCDGWESVQE